tara:strand:- start:44571 stop:44780 length:210 start_codon:yes stop_codon:yes gene_type:complete
MKKVDIQILKECIDRLDEVYSVIMTYGREEDEDTMDALGKIDDIQNYIEDMFDIDRDLHSNEIINNVEQ